jgi:DNA primase
MSIDDLKLKIKTEPDLIIDTAYSILSTASSIYFHQSHLSGEPSEFEKFSEERGLTSELIDGYRIGLAPDYNILCEWFENITDKDEREKFISAALAIGIIRLTDNGNQDVFKNRIMFPIINNSQVIGFTSRAIQYNTRNVQTPKYMNSIDSIVFNKRNILYGLDLAKNAIREKDAVILVEGNMDQIALYKNGFYNSVAVMGISLGAPSIERLLSMTKNIYLALDSDSAGFTAMERINRQLAENGIVAKYLDFSPEKDPDEFLKARGALAFQTKIDNALPAFDVLLDRLIPEKLPDVVDRKLDLLKKAFEILEPLGMNLNATERIVSFARRVGLMSTPLQLQNAYEQYLDGSRRKNE